jgi:zinc protease
LRGSSARALLLAAVVACGARPPKFAVHHTEQRGKLDGNGLRFVIMPDAASRMVEVAVRYEVGAADDPPGKSGLAHLVEHLMFQTRPDGTEARPLLYFVDQVAIRWNAYTSADSTHYMTLGPGRSADALVQLEAMRLFYGCEGISEAEFLREREVVRNEVRQRIGTPEGAIEPLLLGFLYADDHPYRHSVGGTDEELASITLADACAFIADYYVPSRATVVVAGDVEVDDAIKSVTKWFGKLPARTGAARRQVPAVELELERREVAVDLERPIVAVSWQLPARSSTMADAVIEEMMSRLSWVRGAGLTYGFATRIGLVLLGGRSAPVLTLLIEVDDEDDVGQALEFTWKATLHDSPYIDEDWTKSQMKTSYIMSLEPLEARAILVADEIQFTTGVEFLSRSSYVFAGLDAIEALDLYAVQAAAKAILAKPRAQVTVFRANRRGIKGDPRSSFALEPIDHQLGEPDVDPADARRKVELPASGPSAIAGAERLELSNGLRVVLLPVPDAPLPVVTMQVVIGVGDAATPDAPWIPEATADFSMAPRAYRQRMSRGGVRVGCTTTLDHTTCTGEAISVYLPDMITGLEKTLSYGSYDQRAIEKAQEVEREQLKRRRQRVLDELIRQEVGAIYGAEHPYARAATASARAAGAFGRDDLLAFRDKHYTAANTTVVIAGAFDRAAALKAIEGSFGEWKRGAADPAISAPAAARTGPSFVGVIREDRPQMDIAIAYPSAAGIGGQHAARLVMTQMLAAEAWRLRDTLGVTYGTSVRRDDRRGPTFYEVRTAVDIARAGEALTALRTGIDALRRGDDFEVRFVRARRKVVQRLLGEDDGSLALARKLSTIARFDVAPGYFEQLLVQAAALSTRQLKEIIEGELAPEGETVVLSADRATLVAAFEAAGITDYKLVEPVAEQAGKVAP